MPRRKFIYDRSAGGVVEITPAEVRPLCDEITASVKRYDAPVKAHRRSIAKWPIHSEDMAVNPEEVHLMKERKDLQHLKTEYDRHGRPILRDQKHFTEYAKARGFYKRNAGYSDPTPDHYVESTHGPKVARANQLAMQSEIRREINRIEHECGLQISQW